MAGIYWSISFNNTWDTRSMFTQLCLPEAFSVKLALVDAEGGIADDLRAGNDRSSCDTFYHWGALLGFMALLEP